MEENKNTSNPEMEENTSGEIAASGQNEEITEATATGETAVVEVAEPAEGSSEAEEASEAEEEPSDDNSAPEIIADFSLELPPTDAVAAEEIATKKKPIKKILQGKVISNKPDKTIIVNVVRKVAHPLYKKYYKQSKKFMAHDENNECNTGDSVRIKECRPLSARKRWELLDILERAK